jgi:hypothetical protein
MSFKLSDFMRSTSEGNGVSVSFSAETDKIYCYRKVLYRYLRFAPIYATPRFENLSPIPALSEYEPPRKDRKKSGRSNDISGKFYHFLSSYFWL